jgi:hypothetical protein
MSAVKEKKPAKVTSVAEYIAMQIKLCGKSQIDIARETGFDKPNIITMIKQGKTKLPMDKIGRFAKAIGVDPIHLFRLCMNEYWSDTWAEIERLIGQPVLTMNELEIIEIIRQSSVVNPKLRTIAEKKKMIAFIETLKGEDKAV